ncbi:hypothetical protein GCM10028818_14370 [Spirosoma horti]
MDCIDASVQKQRVQTTNIYVSRYEFLDITVVRGITILYFLLHANDLSICVS